MSLLDDTLDDQMLASLAQYDAAAPASSSRAGASVSATAGAVGMAPPATSFSSAFASFTGSSLYTSVANMPRPAPAPAAASPATTAHHSSAPHAAAAGRSFAPASAAASAGAGARPSAPAAAVAKRSPFSILVSPRQKGNPVLVHISHVAWEFGDKAMVPDYELGETTCALYLSLKYHMLHGNYLQARLHAAQHQFTTRIILTYVDVEDSEKPMLDITRLAFAFGWTVVCCWSPEEMARYLETFKLYEKKTSDAIQERVDETDLRSKLVESLTTVRSINKTDVANLLSNFHSFAGVAKASKEDLTNCPGMGEKKVHRLHHVMNQPFITSQASRGPAEAAGVTPLTPAQMASQHAANVAKARAQAAQSATQRKGAIQYVDSFPPAPIVNASAAPSPAASAAAAAGPTRAFPSASATPSAPPSSTSVMPSTLPQPIAPSSAAHSSPAVAAPPPLSYDPMDFVS